jgi:hypothetical protein
VVLGGVSDDEAPRRLAIEMLLVGGRHRTVTTVGDLAREAGLEVTAACHNRQASSSSNAVPPEVTRHPALTEPVSSPRSTGRPANHHPPSHRADGRNR